MTKPYSWLALATLSLLSATTPLLAGDWSSETAMQAYLLKGCNADSGTLLLSINTGARVYRISSSSPLFRVALSVGKHAVAKAKPIQVFALSGFPTSTFFYMEEGGGCKTTSGVDILGISIDKSAQIAISPRNIAGAGMDLRRNGSVLTVSGGSESFELLDLKGRVVATSTNGTDGVRAVSLGGIPKGTFIVRAGSKALRFAHF